jgi:Tol biopolymer transport system component
MTSNSTRSVCTRRRIGRILCRVLMCAGGFALASATAHAQTTLARLAYRADSYDLVFDCGGPGACDNPYYRVARISSVVTPWERFGAFGASTLTWSPDGSLIAVTDHYNSFIIPAMGAVTPIRITNDPSRQFDASAWSPDGRQIAFLAWNTESHEYELGVMNPDGSGVRALSTAAAQTGDHPAWSPDSARIAFTCRVELSNLDICIVNRDGTGLVRLTSDAAGEWSPVWSPDGTRIAFSTNQFGSGNVLALMNADGSGASPIGTSIAGWPGSWSPDGAQIAFTAFGTPEELCYVDDFGELRCLGYVPTAIYMTTPDGTVVTRLVDSGGDPAWMPRVPVATFTVACDGLTCSFDGSASTDQYGTISNYAWSFGDGTTGSGATISHTYAVGGAYSVTLTVSDGNSTGTKFQTVSLLVAAITSTCNGLTCTFDGSSSQGLVSSYAWAFGDGRTGSGVTASHTYGTDGTYLVSLVVTDNIGATGLKSGSVTVFRPTMHIGDLDGTRTNQQSTWTALVTITVHDMNHGPVANATVSGSWNIGGTGSCTTGASGQCVISKSTIPRNTKSVTFTIVDVTNALSVYRPFDNHDPEGDSNGTSITVINP